MPSNPRVQLSLLVPHQPLWNITKRGCQRINKRQNITYQMVLHWSVATLVYISSFLFAYNDGIDVVWQEILILGRLPGFLFQSLLTQQSPVVLSETEKYCPLRAPSRKMLSVIMLCFYFVCFV